MHGKLSFKDVWIYPPKEERTCPRTELCPGATEALFNGLPLGKGDFEGMSEIFGNLLFKDFREELVGIWEFR